MSPVCHAQKFNLLGGARRAGDSLSVVAEGVAVTSARRGVGHGIGVVARRDSFRVTHALAEFERVAVGQEFKGCSVRLDCALADCNRLAFDEKVGGGRIARHARDCD